MELNKHYSDGSCAPRPGSYYSTNQTFSMGIFQAVATANGKGIKRGPVKVRVKGPCSDPEKVYAKTREITIALDAGTYTGPKNVNV